MSDRLAKLLSRGRKHMREGVCRGPNCGGGVKLSTGHRALLEKELILMSDGHLPPDDSLIW